ncbi:MAG: ArsR family transcriptional regulator [Nitrososphaerota archaeon]|nr:ArsR family transcriptional regulator [Nitrososphaerales archaeon]MDW8045552.1 ArsR family transcriptional regulator [Nitrososphaerota archaeon]
MSTTELDRLLTVVQNPIRREIIRRLSQEPSYPLEISEDLGIYQPLVSKHLKVMEEAEVVEAKTESSPYGPDRKMYYLAKAVSLTVDFSPDLYNVSVSSLQRVTLPKSIGEFKDRLDHLTSEYHTLDQFADLIADLDRRIAELEKERAALLHLRSLAMRAAKESIKGKPISFIERMIAYHILNKNERTVREISKSLNIKEDVVKRVLDQLVKRSIIRPF